MAGMAIGSTLHERQNTFRELDAAPCGYCTPGTLLTAMVLLWTNPTPDPSKSRKLWQGTSAAAL